MSPLNPAMRQLAKRLIAYEAEENKASQRYPGTIFGKAAEKLRRPLSGLAGTIGFHSLLARALALSAGEVPWLRGANIKTDGAIAVPAGKGLLNHVEIGRGEVILLAQLLGLLVTFIGEALTVRLVIDTWPKASIKDFDAGGKNQKRKEHDKKIRHA